ncbi:helix-turn-helix domain-containing protein [Neobacillus cucumis]|uniref:Transcriptional regulator n=1 Tax=Neobacillus cucumis TaxID=1740721 RepID=A0A2N5HB75_9BACI|nr:helix-turn-helix domain-containing protein [Neobacillus cucumis]PLS02771.1 transcriptional regulator [Neobacillus cucumis]
MGKETTVDVILHPVRMRIIQSLINQEMTSQQIKELLPDIPQASLYRHIKKLLEAGVIHIIDEIPNRGTIEKVYSLQDPANASIDPEKLKNFTKEEHMDLFFKFMANILGEYERYLNQPNIDLVRDGVAFRQTSVFLDDQEYAQFVKDVSEVYVRAMQKMPEKGRRRRTIATIIIPE